MSLYDEVYSSNDMDDVQGLGRRRRPAPQVADANPDANRLEDDKNQVLHGGSAGPDRPQPRLLNQVVGGDPVLMSGVAQRVQQTPRLADRVYDDGPSGHGGGPREPLRDEMSPSLLREGETAGGPRPAPTPWERYQDELRTRYAYERDTGAPQRPQPWWKRLIQSVGESLPLLGARTDTEMEQIQNRISREREARANRSQQTELERQGRMTRLISDMSAGQRMEAQEGFQAQQQKERLAAEMEREKLRQGDKGDPTHFDSQSGMLINLRTGEARPATQDMPLSLPPAPEGLRGLLPPPPTSVPVQLGPRLGRESREDSVQLQTYDYLTAPREQGGKGMTPDQAWSFMHRHERGGEGDERYTARQKAVDEAHMDILHRKNLELGARATKIGAPYQSGDVPPDVKAQLDAINGQIAQNNQEIQRVHERRWPSRQSQRGAPGPAQPTQPPPTAQSQGAGRPPIADNLVSTDPTLKKAASSLQGMSLAEIQKHIDGAKSLNPAQKKILYRYFQLSK